ncbi:MAG: 2-isopropylmalate synthase [Alphaproteobacteria bacterium]|nr:2-isopropylmalate synthase [Alphaproteobacteria bacterium]
MPTYKYRPAPPIDLPDRRWPSRTITRAPIWCSVDLRDGNQALVEPMGIERKTRLFQKLCAIGYKEIEIGFPAASQPDFDFARHLIDNDLIPPDVWPQVLVQCRDHLIEKTFAALKGYPRAIVHFYNSTSTLHRQVVFQADRDAVKAIACNAAAFIKKTAAHFPATDWRFQYSPESFTQTELDYALEVCEAVQAIMAPTVERPIIFNLPATVEIATPNHYADMIEWMDRHFKQRDQIILSLHPHNDRGTGIAATELALLAGADRVEGTLFGNGERTGNVDLVTLGLNMVTQGVDAGIDFSNLRDLVAVVEHCNRMPIADRHPYAGSLVFTAFSGSHQDAINKGLKAMQQRNSPLWQVPYLPIDPADIGASYEAVIRINSQSGKGGVAFILESAHGIKLPRRLQIEFSVVIQQLSEKKEEALNQAEGFSSDKNRDQISELTSQEIYDAFCQTYLNEGDGRYQWRGFTIIETKPNGVLHCRFDLVKDGRTISLDGRGETMLQAFLSALNANSGLTLDIIDYSEHALGVGKNASAITYMECRNDGQTLHGAGRDTSIDVSSLKSILSATNRFLAQHKHRQPLSPR